MDDDLNHFGEDSFSDDQEGVGDFSESGDRQLSVADEILDQEAAVAVLRQLGELGMLQGT